MELQEPWKADCPLDLGLQTADPGSCQALPACFCVVDRCAVPLLSYMCGGITVSLELSAWGGLGWGLVLRLPSLSESVPLSKSSNCRGDLPELLLWCQRRLLAQLHACAKWLWSCPRGLSRVGIKSCIWLAGLSFLPGCNCFF